MNDRLIAELADLENSEFHKMLLETRKIVIDTWTASDDDRRDLIAKGEKRILDRLITDIEEARDNLKKRRQSAERSPMSNAF